MSNNRVIDLTSRSNNNNRIVLDLTNDDDNNSSSSSSRRGGGGHHKHNNNNKTTPSKRSRINVEDDYVDDDDEIVATTTSSSSSKSVRSPNSSTSLTTTTTVKQTTEQKINEALKVIEDAVNGNLPLDKPSKSNTSLSNGKGGGLGITRTYVMNKLVSFIPCPICLGTPINTLTTTKCGHIFCKTCIEGAIHATKKCAVCNTPLKPKEIHPIYL